MKGSKIAVDLGGTHLRVALLKDNKITEFVKKDTLKDKNKLLEELVSSISQCINAGKNVKGIGVSAAGEIKEGRIMNSPNLPIKNFDLKRYLKKNFKKKVEIENDANCVALAEARLGCKENNFFVLTLGTGIGGGIIINNKLYVGRASAGELGHILLYGEKDFEKAWQTCRKLSKKYFGEILLIKNLLKKKDKKAKEVLDNYSEVLGLGIVSLINTLDPEVVILDGGAKEAGKKFLDRIQKKVDEYSFFSKKTKVQWTKLKHAGILGAGLLLD